jgi:DNA-binding FadR family transcriptional regulator
MRTLNRETLAEQVADAIVEFIGQQELAPGDPLPSTAKLAEAFSVSRPVIREALKTLEGREIVQISNGRNPIVKPVTSDTLRNFFSRAIVLERRSIVELLEIRRGLEIQSALLAARSISDAEVAELEHVLDGMRAHVTDPGQYTELDVQFHLKIAVATRNSLMYFLIESIRDVLADTIQEGLRSRYSQEQVQRVQHLHEAIFHHIKQRDPVQAAEAMATHFDDAINAIVRAEEFENTDE